MGFISWWYNTPEQDMRQLESSLKNLNQQIAPKTQGGCLAVVLGFVFRLIIQSMTVHLECVLHHKMGKNYLVMGKVYSLIQMVPALMIIVLQALINPKEYVGETAERSFVLIPEWWGLVLLIIVASLIIGAIVENTFYGFRPHMKAFPHFMGIPRSMIIFRRLNVPEWVVMCFIEPIIATCVLILPVWMLSEPGEGASNAVIFILIVGMFTLRMWFFWGAYAKMRLADRARVRDVINHDLQANTLHEEDYREYEESIDRLNEYAAGGSSSGAAPDYEDQEYEKKPSFTDITGEAGATSPESESKSATTVVQADEGVPNPDELREEIRLLEQKLKRIEGKPEDGDPFGILGGKPTDNR